MVTQIGSGVLTNMLKSENAFQELGEIAGKYELKH